MSDLGGRTVDEATRRMMGYVFTNPLSLQFNLIGRHGKRAFGTSRVFQLVYRKYSILFVEHNFTSAFDG